MADRANVSKSLVSLVMRGSSNVSEGRREAVLKAARDLGYRPNELARGLVQRRTHTIGVLLSDCITRTSRKPWTASRMG